MMDEHNIVREIERVVMGSTFSAGASSWAGASFTVGIPKEMVGKLTCAGEKTKRFDTKRLRWTINGRNVRIDDMSSDVIVLETFLRGERKLPNWKGPDSDIRSIQHMGRLEELLDPKCKRGKNVWQPLPCFKNDNRQKYHSETNHPYGEVEVEIDI